MQKSQDGGYGDNVSGLDRDGARCSDRTLGTRGGAYTVSYRTLGTRGAE
jgi:hypothetical protein